MAIIYKNFDDVEVVNTTTETELFSFDFGVDNLLKSNGILGATGSVRITVAGLIDANAAGDKNASFKGYMGTSSLQAVAADMPPGFPYFKVTFTLHSRDVDDKLAVIRELEVGDTNATSSSEGVIGGLGVHNVASVDLTTDTEFALKVTLGQANTNFKVTKMTAVIETV